MNRILIKILAIFLGVFSVIELYTNNLNNREFDKETPLNLSLASSASKQLNLNSLRDAGGLKVSSCLTQSKTDSSSCLCIRGNPIEVEKKLSLIPKDDQIILSYFFRTLVQTFCAGHVIFGTKPMCITGYRNPFYRNYFAERTLPDWLSSSSPNLYNSMMEIGLATWKKYESHFPMQKFALVDYQKANGTVTIALINKQEFLKKIRKESQEFQRFYHRKIEAEEILNQLLSRKRLFFDLIEQHQDMLGILLGYGTNNSKLFERKINLLIGLGKLRSNRLYCKPKPSQGFSSLEEELNFIDEKTKFPKNAQTSEFSFTPKVGFIADAQERETQHLRRQYSLEQKRIVQIYSTGDFLKITLSKLTEL